MRVSDQKPVEMVREVDETEDTESSELAADAADRKETVSLRQKQEIETAAAEVRREVSASRSVQLAQIEAAVRSGTYRPDPRAIAERILQTASLNAQINAQLREIP